MNSPKKNSKKILFIILLLVIVAIGGILAWKNQKMEILTNEFSYENEGAIRLTIKNLLFKRICFSSCYPYYLERKQMGISGFGEWESYIYQECEKPDLIEKCMRPGETKIFEIDLPKARAGTHRIVIPGCFQCYAGAEFQETKRFYSNEFEIK